MRKRQSVKGHRSNGRGTPQIDRTFPLPIGKVRLASGTQDVEAYADINAMLTALCKSVPPRWDVLLAIKARRIAPLHALSLWRLNKLDEVPTVDTLLLLKPEYERWKVALDASEAYKGQIASTFTAMLKEGATVGDLPELLKARREQCRLAATPVAFNRGKAHVQGFVRDLLGNDSQLYRLVTKVPLLPVESQPERRGMGPKELMVRLADLPEPHCSYALSMAVTGMGPKEYWGKWSLGAGLVDIRGTKRKARVRIVPLWAPGLPVVPRMTRSAFEGMWSRHVVGLGIYDLRRSFAVWMEDAHIERSRRRIYMGHAAGDITGLYEQRDLEAWRAADGAALLAHAGPYLPTSTPTLVLHTA